jgi:N-acetylmuramoyl-L-alanine amidase
VIARLWQPSPNFGERRGGARVDLVVIHYTAMKGAQAAVDWLCNADAQVSCHYLIAETGAVTQMVDEGSRAWHAGVSHWRGHDDVNSRSIGVELDNDGLSDFADVQMLALENLLGEIIERHAVAPDMVVGHSDISPGRKIDPGARFDWRRLARAGLSVWPEEGAEPGDFFADASRFGYGPASDEDARAAVLAAFRLRFRPGATGPLDTTDAVLAADLAARYGVDGSTLRA